MHTLHEVILIRTRQLALIILNYAVTLLKLDLNKYLYACYANHLSKNDLDKHKFPICVKHCGPSNKKYKFSPIILEFKSGIQ